MKIKYALESLDKSIFLAGPTPRSADVKSWRPEAIAILERYGFSGTVLVPETADGEWRHNYDDQIGWEWDGLNQASTIVFWCPRDLVEMPAFTTNVEFGLYAATSKVVYGRPDEAPKMKYLDALAQRYNIKIHNTLEQTILAAVTR